MYDLIYSIPLSYYAFSALALFVSVFGVTLIAITKGPKTKLNWSFFLLCLSVLQYTLFYYIWQVAKEPGLAEFHLRTCMIGVVFMPPLLTQFIKNFLNLRINNFFLSINFLLSLLIVSFIYTDMWANNFEQFMIFPIWGRANYIFHVQMVHYFSNIIYSIFMLYRATTYTQGLLKRQIQYVFYGLLLGYISGSMNILVWYRIAIPPFTNILTVLFALCIAYAMFRHQFLKIRIVIKRTLVFTGLIASAFMLFGIMTYIVNTKIGNIFNIDQNTATIISILFIALSSDPIYRFLQNKTDRFLFQKKYAYQKILNDASNGMARITDLDDLMKLLHTFLHNKMRIKQVAIYLRNESNNCYDLYREEDTFQRPISLKYSDPVIRNLLKKQTSLVTEDLPHLIGTNASGLAKQDKIKSLLHPYKALVAIPSFIQTTLVAVFLLGEKRSDDHYNGVDIDTLEALASEAAIALENGHLYAHLQKSYNQLKSTQAQLVQSEKMASLGQLAAGIAHEVNNPLTIIGGQARVRLSKLKASKGPEANFLREAIKQSDRATVITQKLLKFAKPRKGELQAIDISSLLKETLQLAKQQTPMKQVKVLQEYPEKQASIKAHRHQIQEVFLNIIINACQAMPEEGTLSIKVKNHTNKVQITFQDTGKGILKENINKIFDPFFTTKQAGTGLGLFVSYQIIKAHGGTLQAKSLSENGTKIDVHIPVSEDGGN